MNVNVYVPRDLQNLAEIFGEEHRLYIVGGYVRNAFLGACDTDIDIASDLSPDDVKSLVTPYGYKVVAKSLKMGTVLITGDDNTFEHTTFRLESYNTNKHQPDDVFLTDDIREDAKRRDFTVNTLYYDILNKKVVDFYNGVIDIKNKKLKAVETADYVFSVDGLRILRMVRLVSELGFGIDTDTYNSVTKHLTNLAGISGERKYVELVKILNSGSKYSFSPTNGCEIGLSLLNELNAWGSIISLGDIVVPQECFTDNIYKLFVNLYGKFKYMPIEDFVIAVFGKKALNRSKNEQKFLKNLLFVYYILKDKAWYNFVKIYPYLSDIFDLLQSIDNVMYQRLSNMYSEAIKRKTPLSLKDVRLKPKDLDKLYVSKNKYAIYLKRAWRLVIRQPKFNKRRLLIKYIKRKDAKC